MIKVFKLSSTDLRVLRAGHYRSILLAGSLSMFFAEVFAGSSPLWFVDLWALTVTFPLYTMHLLFFFNLAYRFDRLSPRSLYLWGVLFGFYEFWITKVLWSGFIGESPLLGTFLGIAVFEFILVALFWHPIMSFMLPILVIEILSLSYGQPSVPVPSHDRLLRKTRKNKLLAYYFVLNGATILAFNSSFNILISHITAIGSIAIIVILIRICRKTGIQINNILLGKKGMIIVSLYLALLYGIMFPLLLPERIPGLGTIIFTLLLYVVILLLIYCDKHTDTHDIDYMDTAETFEVADLKKYLVIFMALLTIFVLAPPVCIIMFMMIMFGDAILGVGLFLRAIYDSIRT